jgi:hypothetical protein
MWLVSGWVGFYMEETNMSCLKKVATMVLAVGLLVLGGLMAHNVYAGKPAISLNSPVSFPVDI